MSHESLQETARQIRATAGIREERNYEFKDVSRLWKSVNNPNQKQRLDHWQHKKATWKCSLVLQAKSFCQGVIQGWLVVIERIEEGICFVAMMACYLSALQLWKKAQQLRVSKCVSATQACKQGCLMCSQTLKQTWQLSCFRKCIILHWCTLPIVPSCNCSQFVAKAYTHTQVWST